MAIDKDVIKDYKTRLALEGSPYPICVTIPLPMQELRGWIMHFSRKMIGTILREYKPGKYALYRAVTDEELEELMDGTWLIRGNSFYIPDQAHNRKKPGPLYDGQ